MSTIKSFEDVQSWVKARQVCKQIGQYIEEERFKKNYRLIHQIEGSSGSIMDNIAEGFKRGTRAEFVQFLGYAKGSCGELRSQLYRAFDRAYLNQQEFDELVEQVLQISRLLQSFIAYLLQTNIAGVRKKTQ